MSPNTNTSERMCAEGTIVSSRFAHPGEPVGRYRQTVSLQNLLSSYPHAGALLRPKLIEKSWLIETWKCGTEANNSRSAHQEVYTQWDLKLITVFPAVLDPTLRHMNSVHIIIPYLLTMHINIIIISSSEVLCASVLVKSGLENRDYGHRGTAALTMRHPSILKSWH
jgi:hypothetical protein